MCISFANRKQKLPTIDIHFGQCDQMWQHYVTLAELHKSLAFFDNFRMKKMMVEGPKNDYPFWLTATKARTTLNTISSDFFATLPLC